MANTTGVATLCTEAIGAWDHSREHFFFFSCVGGSKAANIASSKTFFNPFWKAKTIQHCWAAIDRAHTHPNPLKTKQLPGSVDTQGPFESKLSDAPAVASQSKTKYSLSPTHGFQSFLQLSG
jgi:hypothetical protein